ncbi:methyltransferase domain-containing protein [Sphingosinicella sp. YJ22]|uniref:class I SAM-dependent methyltransferase n=1 Tax=Sphingosinicella sp. YJ22 TaxID=1104780 RepID=UPI00140C2C96|nr:methyltransferase domain-containing protein [Sphingosinicella sp. YJ22]
MASIDSAFAGSIPAIYNRCLGPMLFEPYALDLARRVAPLRPRALLETAAGTGIVTAALAEALPETDIVATDLNQAMLDVAAERIASPRVAFQAADAQSLPFADDGFDAVVCQFGVMFFPDRVGAYREARRVLRGDGAFIFNAWDSLDANPASKAMAEAMGEVFPDDPPSFLQRTPFGYHDPSRIEADLRAAGFSDISFETVVLPCRASSAHEAATGMCRGSPLRAEIEARDATRLDAAVEAAAKALERLSGPALDVDMSAHVFTARV